jgi:hypothetical protein
MLTSFCFSHISYSNVSDVIGVPVFYFVLPLYSFWRMDDFTWGTTRVIASTPAADVSKKATTADELDEELGSC